MRRLLSILVPLAAALAVGGLERAGAAEPASSPVLLDDPSPRIVSLEERRLFYRAGGKDHVGMHVHLHVEASVLRRKPREMRTTDGRERLVFENRTVPIVVDPQSPYWKKAARDLKDVHEFCLHGLVRIPLEDERRRAHMYVERIQTIESPARPTRSPGKRPD